MAEQIAFSENFWALKAAQISPASKVSLDLWLNWRKDYSQHNTMKTKEDALRKIDTIDEVLSVHRQAWLDCNPDRKEFWSKKIDALLDDRLVAMQARDSMK